MKIKQPIIAFEKEEGIIPHAELWKGDFIAWVKHTFTQRIQKTIISLPLEKYVFRLISPEVFCVDDYRDVRLNFVPEVGQKIRIEGITGVYQIIRKSDQGREFEYLREEEGLGHTSILIAEEYLKEKYPYLLSRSATDYHTGLYLEVIEIMNIQD